jgi:hypothetical protein
MRVPPILSAVATATALFLAAGTALAESAQDIVKTAMEKYEQRLANVQTVSIVQSAMGMQIETEMEKRMVDGRAVLVPTEDGSPGTDPGTFFAQMQEMATAAKLKGKEKVDGVDCWRIEVDDMSAFDAEPQTGATSDFEAKTGTFWIDRQDYLLRRMSLDGETMNDGQAMAVTMDMTMRDYRDTQGFLWPFATDMVVRGLDSGMSEEDLEEAKAALAEMKAEMAEMPESQRKMMESMMGGQMQKLEEMVTSGEMKMSIEVVSLSVNGG